jgi:hypothetical protein
MEARAVRRKLERELGRRVPDSTWSLLLDRGYVDDVLLDPNSWRDVVNNAELASAAVEADRESGKFSTSSFRPVPATPETPPADSYEQRRGRASSRALVDVAGSTKIVETFRDGALEGRLLTREEAEAFVASPALAVFSRKKLEGWGVPFVGHTARRILDPPAHVRRTADSRHFLRELVAIDPGGLEVEGLIPLQSVERHRLDLKFPDRNGVPRPSRIWRGSVLAELKELADRLAKRYGWTEAEAAAVVLTGAEPWVPGVRVKSWAGGFGDFERATITVEAEAWVSEDAIARAFREHRALFTERRIRRAEHQTEVFTFVESARASATARRTWSHLAKEWNRTHTDRRVREDGGSLRRDYHDAKQALLFPYGWTQGKGPRGRRSAKEANG